MNLRQVEKCLQKPLKGRLPRVQNQYLAFKLVSVQERVIPVTWKMYLTVHIKVPLSSQVYLHY